MLLALMATTLLAPSTVEAGGGKSSKAKIQVQNSNPPGGRAITVFVVPEGTAAPTTKAQANALLRKTISAGKTEVFELKNGRFVVAAGDTSSFSKLGNNDTIPSGSFATSTVVLNKNTVKLQVSTPAGATLPFKPTVR